MGLAAVKRRKGKTSGAWSNPKAWKGLAQSINMVKPVKPLRQMKSK